MNLRPLLIPGLPALRASVQSSTPALVSMRQIMRMAIGDAPMRIDRIERRAQRETVASANCSAVTAGRGLISAGEADMAGRRSASQENCASAAAEAMQEGKDCKPRAQEEQRTISSPSPKADVAIHSIAIG